MGYSSPLAFAVIVCIYQFCDVQGRAISDVRLVGVSGLTGGMAGRVEVYYDNQWITVCQSSITKEEADVICRQLGFPESVYYGSVNELRYFQQSSVTTVLSGVNCRGDESRLANCSVFGSGVTSSCSHSSDLAVMCAGTYSSSNAQSLPSKGDLRLNTEGDSHPRTFSGRLEIYISGQWGTVCDNGFGQNEADTACRQLGFLSALYYCPARQFGDQVSYGWMVLTAVHHPVLSRLCWNVQAMKLGKTTVHACVCDHNNDVILVCLGVGSLHLEDVHSSTDAVSRSSGRLEVFGRYGWGSVCDKSFGQEEARIACHQLGFSAALSYERASSRYGHYTYRPLLLSGLQCRSDDNFLLLCDRRSTSYCSPRYDDIVLSCTTSNQNNVTLAVYASIAVGLFPALCFFVCIYFIVSNFCCRKEPQDDHIVHYTPRTVASRSNHTAVNWAGGGASTSSSPAFSGGFDHGGFHGGSGSGGDCVGGGGFDGGGGDGGCDGGGCDGGD